MINTNYALGKQLSFIVKNNIQFNRDSILNFTCSNYVDSILEESEETGYDITEEQRMKLLVLKNKLIK